MTITDKIKAWREKSKAASVGPWAEYEKSPQSILREYEILMSGGGILFRSTSYGKMREDAEFIAAARTAVPELCDEVEELTRKGEEACQLAGNKMIENHDLKAKLAEAEEKTERWKGLLQEATESSANHLAEAVEVLTWAERHSHTVLKVMNGSKKEYSVWDLSNWRMLNDALSALLKKWGMG